MKIIRCHFCGSPDTEAWNDGRMWRVICADCEAQGPSMPTKESAIGKWNEPWRQVFYLREEREPPQKKGVTIVGYFGQFESPTTSSYEGCGWFANGSWFSVDRVRRWSPAWFLMPRPEKVK